MDINLGQTSYYGRVEHRANSNAFMNGSVFKHFRRDSSIPICDTIRAGSGFPDSDPEANLAEMEHQQKGENL